MSGNQVTKGYALYTYLHKQNNINRRQLLPSTSNGECGIDAFQLLQEANVTKNFEVLLDTLKVLQTSECAYIIRNCTIQGVRDMQENIEKSMFNSDTTIYVVRDKRVGHEDELVVVDGQHRVLGLHFGLKIGSWSTYKFGNYGNTNELLSWDPDGLVYRNVMTCLGAEEPENIKIRVTIINDIGNDMKLIKTCHAINSQSKIEMSDQYQIFYGIGQSSSELMERGKYAAADETRWSIVAVIRWAQRIGKSKLVKEKDIFEIVSKIDTSLTFDQWNSCLNKEQKDSLSRLCETSKRHTSAVRLLKLMDMYDYFVLNVHDAKRRHVYIGQRELLAHIYRFYDFFEVLEQVLGKGNEYFSMILKEWIQLHYYLIPDGNKAFILKSGRKWKEDTKFVQLLERVCEALDLEVEDEETLIKIAAGSLGVNVPTPKLKKPKKLKIGDALNALASVPLEMEEENSEEDTNNVISTLKQGASAKKPLSYILEESSETGGGGEENDVIELDESEETDQLDMDEKELNLQIRKESVIHDAVCNLKLLNDWTSDKCGGRHHQILLKMTGKTLALIGKLLMEEEMVTLGTVNMDDVWNLLNDVIRCREKIQENKNKENVKASNLENTDVQQVIDESAGSSLWDHPRKHGSSSDDVQVQGKKVSFDVPEPIAKGNDEVHQKTQVSFDVPEPIAKGNDEVHQTMEDLVQSIALANEGNNFETALSRPQEQTGLAGTQNYQ